MCISAVMCATLTGCPGSKSKPTSFVPDNPCTQAAERLINADLLQTEGYLGRALPLVELAVELCPSDDTRDALAKARSELWLDRELVDADDEQRAKARLLYQAGQLLRIVDENYDLSLRRFEESYALWSHPLTVVRHLRGVCSQRAHARVDWV
jgi:hypothetical protein